MDFLKKFTNKITVPEATVQLKLSTYSVSLGENLQGTLSVASEKTLTQQKYDAKLYEQAKVLKNVYDSALKTSIPKMIDETAILFNIKPLLSGPTHFANGENRDFPININIPAGSTPTSQNIDRRVTWTMKGVLAVDGRPDRTSQTSEIQVIAPTMQPTIQREVIRTVVMIPCKYCQGLMDQTLTVCPNCGAKRTI